MGDCGGASSHRVRIAADPLVGYHGTTDLKEEPMFAVTRNYTGAGSLIDAMERRHTEVEGLITSVPGFVSYFAVRAGDALTTFTVCDDRAGCEETTRRAAEWVRENLSDAKISPPSVNSGDVFISLSGPGVPQALGASASAHIHS